MGAETGIPVGIRPPRGLVPLLIPYERRAEAGRAGAEWNAAHRCWTIDARLCGTVPRWMLPTRNRPDLRPPYLVIALVPQTSWGRNLRSMMGQEAWREFARSRIYASTGSLCRICGGRGDKWPVEADEAWRYDDATGVQTLHAVVPLCPACHEVRSAGLAMANGRGRAIVAHLSMIERITTREADARIDEALAVWKRRSQRRWTIDMSMMSTRYGITVEHDADVTQDAHAALVADAIRRRGVDGGRR